MKLDQLFNLSELAAMIDGGYVSEKDLGDLSILNYTQKTQWEYLWNDVTRQCRGIIFDRRSGEVAARPFPKFFNYGDDPTEIPAGPIRVTDKLDGSLGILYWNPSDQAYSVATRGAFTSDQAIWATQWIRRRLVNVDAAEYAGATYLFEIIYPENRIVVNYGDRAELVLLEVIDIETGWPIEQRRNAWNGAKADIFDFASLPDLLAAPQRPNSEGFVVYFESTNTRLKVKHEEYVRLHKLVTGLSVKSIWEHLSTGQSVESLCENVPDEFHAWVHAESKWLTDDYSRIEADAIETYNQTLARLNATAQSVNRREFAEMVSSLPNKSLLFSLLDGKSIDAAVWKLIKPIGSTTFKKDADS